MTMLPSACIWNFGIRIEEALRIVKETAFHYIDVETDSLDAPGALQAQKDLGLKVSCVALDHKLPRRPSWDGKNQGAVSHLRQGLQKSRELGARCAYVVPCADRRHLAAFGTALKELAEDAARRDIKLCVEHVPGRALGSARETLDFLKQLNHANLFLLLDVGHTLLSMENPWEVIEAAGTKLGYVLMSDNDGKADRHWPLLDGRLSYESLAKTIQALNRVGYQGTIGLELRKDFASLISGLSKNRNLLIRVQFSDEPKSLREPETRRKQ